MKMYHFFGAILLVLCLAVAAPAQAAGETSDLKLGLKGESSSRPTRSLGEFNVSLDSTLAPQRTMADIVRPTRDLVDLPRATALVPQPPEVTEEPSITPDTPASEGDVSDVRPNLSSTFTFRPGYLQTSLNSRFSAPTTARTLRQNSPRLTLTGSNQQETLPIVRLTAPAPVAIFANRIRARGALPSAAPGSLMNTPTTPTTPSVVDHYLLEATYNFNPAVQGKVSYQRSQFDPTITSQDLQVEGTVDTGKNTAIKAGFQNRTNPTSPEKPGHKKVFTEFILKF